MPVPVSPPIRVVVPAVLLVLAALVGTALGGGMTQPNVSASAPDDGAVNTTVSRARGELFGDLTSVGALREARERGRLVRSYLPVDEDSPRPGFVPGDVLVIRIESERLASALRARNGSTPTERYLDYVNHTGARLQVVQTSRTVAPQLRRQRIVVNESRIRVLAESDTRWVLLDTGNVTGGNGNGATDRDAGVRVGQEYGVWFDFAATGDGLPIVDERPRVGVVNPTVEFGTGPGRDRLYLSPTANATVHVSSTFPPGTAVRLRPHLPDGTVERRPVLRGRNRTTATIRFDLSGYDEGRTFRLVAVRRDEVIDEVTAVVDTPNATLRPDERDPWDAVIPVTANLSRGGAVVLQSPDGSVVYDSATVTPGTGESLILYLPASDLRNRTTFAVVAYRSLEDDPVPGEAVPYREGGSPVRVTGTYDPEAAPTVSPTASPTPWPSPTATPTERPASGTDTSGASSPATDGDGGGLGPFVAVLAVALVAAGAESLGRSR